MEILAEVFHKQTDLSNPDGKGYETTKKLVSLFGLLDQLGWLIASEEPNNPDTFTLRMLASAHFGKTHATRIELEAHLFVISSQNILCHSDKLFIWREPKTQNRIPESPKSLSRRELEVNELLLSGMTLSSIAVDLGISKRTVEKHVQNLYRKLEVKSYNELIFGKPSK